MEKGRVEERGGERTEPKAPTPTALLTPKQEAGLTLTPSFSPLSQETSALAGLPKATGYIHRPDISGNFFDWSRVGRKQQEL